MAVLFDILGSDISSKEQNLSLSRAEPITNTSHPQNNNEKQKVVSAYRWEDESNGEIYTDVPVEEGEEMRYLPLYVVENGQEFPLQPLSQRKTSFEFVPRLPSTHLSTLTSSESSKAPISTRPSTLSIAPSDSTSGFEAQVVHNSII